MNTNLYCGYYLADGQTSIGPFTADEIRQRNLPPTAQIWTSVHNRWQTLSTLPELNPVRTPGGWSGIWICSFPTDFRIAAWAGFSGQALLLMQPHLSSVSTLLATLPFLLMALHSRGFLQIGRVYELRGVRRGSRLLIMGFLLSAYPLGSFTSGVANGAVWLGTVLLYVDLLPMQFVVDRRLILGLISGKLVTLAGAYLGFLPALVSTSLELVSAVLAWLLFNALASQQKNTVNQNIA